MKWQIKDIITAGAIISALAVIIVQFISITRLESKSEVAGDRYEVNADVC